MRLGDANSELFGKYPRFVGNPRQFMVYDSDSMRLFLESNWDQNNMYSRIGWVGSDGDTVVDKVSVDLDAPDFKCTACDKPYKEEEDECLVDSCSGDVRALFPDADDDAQKIRMMRSDKSKAFEVLGQVMEEVNRLADWLYEQRIPTIGIFTGMGFHVHALHQPRVEPKAELRTTALKWKDELDLETVDKVPIGDTKRLMRMANCARFTADDEHCNLYTVPWTLEEMRNLTVGDVLGESFETRSISEPEWDRPEMRVYDDYEKSSKSSVDEPLQTFNVDVSDIEDENLTEMLEMLLQMPCMYERITQRDPRHPVRMNCAVLLFNRGFSVNDVYTLFKRLGWVDWDPDTTKYYLEQIWDQKYREMSCATIIERGFCVFDEDNRSACPTRGWKGGESWY